MTTFKDYQIKHSDVFFIEGLVFVIPFMCSCRIIDDNYLDELIDFVNLN